MDRRASAIDVGVLRITADHPIHVPRFELVRVLSQRFDVRYAEVAGTRGEIIVEDVKGMKTPVYQLKKKIVEALYGLQISEIR